MCMCVYVRCVCVFVCVCVYVCMYLSFYACVFVRFAFECVACLRAYVVVRM